MAVNRYFNRTLMPYNPIERPMPFDQILQAGAMKQAAVDNMITSADEFQAQKQLTGGRSTTELASQLNDQYVGRASEIQQALMTGAMDERQAAQQLRSVNRDYNKDQYVKAVLMDQTLTPLAAKTEASEKFIAGLGENANWDYDNNKWMQLTKDEINQGYQLDGSRYGLVTQPGFYADHAKELSDLVANSYASKNVSVGNIDFNTGGVYDKSGNKIETLSRNKIDKLIWDFTHRQPIEDSDKMSVKYEMMRSERLGQEFDEDGYYNKLSQSAAMMPFIREQESQGLGRIGGSGGSSGAKDPDTMFGGVYGWAAITTEQGSNALRKHGINEDNSMQMFKGMQKLLSPEGQISSLNTQLNKRNFALKPGSDPKNPEYIYASSGEALAEPAEIRLAESLAADHRGDMQFFTNITSNIEKEFKQKYNMEYSEFMADVETRYLPQIEKKIDDYTNIKNPLNARFKTVEGQGSDSEQADQFKGRIEEVIPELQSSDYMTGSESKNFTNIPFNALFPDWKTTNFFSSEGFDSSLDSPIKRKKHFVKNSLMERGISEEDATKFSQQMETYDQGVPTDLMTGGGGTGSFDQLRATSVPLSMVAEFNTPQGQAIKNILFDKYGDAAAVEVLKKEDRGAYDMYTETRTKFSDRINAFNTSKTGLYMDPETNEMHEKFENSVMRAIDTRAVRLRADKAFSGDKSGAFFKDVLPEGTAAKDYRLAQLYLDRDEDGEWAWYGTMQHWATGNTNTDAAQKALASVAESTKDFPGGRAVIDIKLDDMTAGLLPTDVKTLGTTIETFKAQVYSLGPNEPFEIELPSQMGPHLKVKATKFSSGIKMEGDVFVREGGEIKKMNIMEAYRREEAGKGNNLPENALFQDEETAAIYATKMVQSHANLTENYSFLYDKDGEFQGSDVPDDINERFDQARGALTNTATAAKIRESLPNLFGDDEASNEQEMDRLVNTMLQIMSFETGGQLTPYVTNPDKSAIGLIQFYQSPGTPLSKTIGGKQYTFAELGRMSIADQIQGPVIEYLAEVGKNKVSTPEELYLAVFMPALLDYSENSTRDDVDTSKMNYDTPLVGIGQDLTNRGRIKKGFWANAMAKNPAFKGKRTINDILNTVRQYGANRM